MQQKETKHEQKQHQKHTHTHTHTSQKVATKCPLLTKWWLGVCYVGGSPTNGGHRDTRHRPSNAANTRWKRRATLSPLGERLSAGNHKHCTGSAAQDLARASLKSSWALRHDPCWLPWDMQSCRKALGDDCAQCLLELVSTVHNHTKHLDNLTNLEA